MRDRFRRTVPGIALDWAAKWEQFVANPELAHLIKPLRQEENSNERRDLMAEFRDQVKRAGYLGF